MVRKGGYVFTLSIDAIVFCAGVKRVFVYPTLAPRSSVVGPCP